MNREDIIRMAREAGLGEPVNHNQWDADLPRLERFAQLVAEAEHEKWKEIVESQRQRLQALNEIIGGEDSTTTGNILSYSRWEMRLEDAVAAEREACAKVVETCAWTTWAESGDEREVFSAAIRARGQR